MTVYAPTWQGTSFYGAPDRGLSQDAQKVRSAQFSNRSASDSLFDFKRTQAAYQLSNVINVASNENWDGYQAAPVDISAFSYAISFLNQLPLIYSSPEIAVDSDGEIAFEWDYEPRRIFSVRVGRDGSLSYAGLLGHSSFHGVEIMRDRIPATVLDGIERVANNRL